MEIAPADLAEVRKLYGQGLYLQAFAASQKLGPLANWQGNAALLLGGRLAIQLGGQRTGRLMHLRAFRNSPNYPEAIYYHARNRLERKGPISTWEFLRRHSEWSDVAPELRADWFAFHGFVAARLRDFDRAERFLNRAESLTPDKPWLCIERSAFLEFADRLDEAMDSARRSIELQPWFRPGVQAVAHLMHVRRHPEQAVELLTEACQHLESGIVVAQLASIQMDLHRYQDAKRSYDRYGELSPMMEKDARKWYDSRRADVAYFLGDTVNAGTLAAVVDDPFYQAFAAELAQGTTGREVLPVSIQIAPTTPMVAMTPTANQLLSAVTRYWGVEADPQLPEVFPFDGVPDFRERQWVERNGWHAREFTITSDNAIALIDAKFPFVITNVDAGYGHSQVVIGYDRVRRTLLLTDTQDRPPLEAPVTQMIDRYVSQGPRGLVFVPVARAVALDAIALDDAAEYDAIHRLQVALSEYRREDAGQIVAAMPSGHRLTKLAQATLARFDGKPADTLAALESLLADAPADTTYQLGRLAILRDMGRIAERTSVLRELVRNPDADPLFLQHLAQALIPDARERPRVHRMLQRAIRRRPFAAPAYYLLANLLWEERAFIQAIDAHRFAASLDDREDQFVEAYFRAARANDQTPEAMRFLQVRFQKLKGKSAAPARALFHALTEQDETAAAFEILDQGVKARPDDGELMIFAAEMRTNYDDSELGRELLERAKGKAPINVWRRAAARLASQRPDLVAALELWREVLADEPLATDAMRNIARLTAETEGRAAAMEWLRDLAGKWPHSYPVWQLAIDWHRGEIDADSEPIIRHLLNESPRDAWVRRELALFLATVGKFDAAIAELELSKRDEPDAPSYYYSLGHVLAKADRVAEARKVYEQAVRLSVDNDVAVNELVTLSRGDEEREVALAFVAGELRRQHHLGEGLMAYRDHAIQILDPDDLNRVLDEVLERHPEMWQAWSLSVQQLGMMGRFEEALSLGREAVAQFPLSARLWVDLAEIYQARNDTEGQIESLRGALRVAPGWGVAARELSEALEQNRQIDDARAVLEQAIARSPNDPVNYGYLAEMLWNAGESREAIRRVSHALRVDPGYEWAWRTLGDWAQRADSPEEIIDVAREVARLRPGDPRTWLALSRVLNGLDQAEEAVRALDRAIALNPRSIEAYDLKAERLAEMGRFDEAKIAASPEILAGDPPLSLQGRLAWIEGRRGNYAGAIPPMQALVSIEPGYYWGWQQLAEWQNETGKSEAYLEAASELVKLRPESPVALATRGDARMQTGDREGGKADLRQAQQIAPTYGFAGMLLFDAYFADEEWREARMVLAVLQEHLGGPFVFARQAQLAAREEEKENAIDALRDVCGTPTEGSWPVQTAANALRSAGWAEEADAVLREAWEGDEPFHPWAAIAWVESQAGQRADLATKLGALDKALAQNPRFVQGLDCKAELLARAGRFDEAIAACRPTSLGDRIPTLLRGREAWVIATRGDRARAVEQMAKLLVDDPEYYWGWQQIARWYDASDSYREYLHASEQLVRLGPGDAMSYSHRGEAKRYLGDHAGAREDFARAFEIDPEYAFAGLRLLDELLEATDVEAASATLARLQENVGGPYVAYAAVQVATQRKDAPSALEALQDLVTDDEVTLSLMRKAVDLMTNAGWKSQTDEAIEGLVSNANVQAMLGRLWVERCVERDEWAFVERLPVLLKQGDLGREALLAYIDLLGVPSRASRLAPAVQRFGLELRETDRGWAKVGAALVGVRNYTLAAAWQADWREREDAEPWMLHPLARALRAAGKFAEAVEVSEAALDMNEDDDTTADHEVWLALEAAIAGKSEESHDWLDNVNEMKLDNAFRLLHTLTESLLMVQDAPAGSKRRAFAEARKSIDAALGAVKESDLDDGFELTYQRVVARLAGDVGGIRAWLWAAWRKRSPALPKG